MKKQLIKIETDFKFKYIFIKEKTSISKFVY